MKREQLCYYLLVILFLCFIFEIFINFHHRQHKILKTPPYATGSLQTVLLIFLCVNEK